MNGLVFFGCTALLVAAAMLVVVSRVRMRPAHTEADYWRGLMIAHAVAVLITGSALAVMVLKPGWFS